jgi:tetratricopeptide (TPR) repeat protein
MSASLDDKKTSLQIDFGSMSQTAFEQALTLHGQKKYPEALEEYKKLLIENTTAATALTPEQASVISHNISLIYHELKEPGLSAVYNLKALGLNPRNAEASKFQTAAKLTIESTSFSRDVPFTESLNKLGMKYLSIEIFFVLTLVILFFFLRAGLSYIVQNKKYFMGVVHQQPRKWLSAGLGFGLFVSSALTLIKWVDVQRPRAIVISQQASLSIQPGEDQAQILILKQGQVVEILRSSRAGETEYIQVKFPGAVSGWVKKPDLELYNTVKWP